VPDLAQYKDKECPENMKIQAAMISRMSRDVGVIAELLESLGLDKNTLIMFNSDNGAHGKAGTEAFFKPSGKLRGIKRMMYDGGIRSPMFAYWPGTIEAGSVSKHISAFWDMLPTFSELTGEPINGCTDGISMLPTLLGYDVKQKKHEFLYWELYEGRPNSAVRFGKWKAVVKDRRKGLNLELYDIEKDKAEQFDLSLQHPEVIVKIQNMMQKAHVKNPFWDKSFSPLFNTEAAAEFNGVKPDPSRFYNLQKKK
jgi:arylsulfatase A-like enzyme